VSADTGEETTAMVPLKARAAATVVTMTLRRRGLESAVGQAPGSDVEYCSA
jgi:hypothetical protein